MNGRARISIKDLRVTPPVRRRRCREIFRRSGAARRTATALLSSLYPRPPLRLNSGIKGGPFFAPSPPADREAAFSELWGGRAEEETPRRLRGDTWDERRFRCGRWNTKPFLETDSRNLRQNEPSRACRSRARAPTCLRFPPLDGINAQTGPNFCKGFWLLIRGELYLQHYSNINNSAADLLLKTTSNVAHEQWAGVCIIACCHVRLTELRTLVFNNYSTVH